MAVYRLLWITMAALGALLLTMPLILLSDDVHPHDPAAFQVQAILGGVIGLAVLVYSLWRLLRPLRAPPRE